MTPTTLIAPVLAATSTKASTTTLLTGTKLLPWVLSALVEITPLRNQIPYFCTGVRVSREWVLTAAHCLDQIDSLTVQGHYIGATKQAVDIKKIHVNPHYFADRSFHDLALIEVIDDKAPYIHDVFNGSIENVDHQHEVFRLGLRMDDHGNPVNTTSQAHLLSPVPSFDPIANKTFKSDDLYMMFTQDSIAQVGHSGGPLVVTDDHGNASLLAIHSGVKKLQSRGDYAYSVHLKPYVPWMDSVTGERF